MNYELLYNLEKEENEKLQKQIRELTIDNELYKIRLNNTKELSSKSKATLAPDNKNQEQSITIQQLNIYC